MIAGGVVIGVGGRCMGYIVRVLVKIVIVSTAGVVDRYLGAGFTVKLPENHGLR